MKIILLVIILSSTFLYGKCFYKSSDKTVCQKFNCQNKKELYEYREKKSKEWKTSNYLKLTPKDLNITLEKLIPKKEKTLEDKKELIINKMLLYSKKINNINKNDAQNIKRWLKKLKIDNLDNVEKIYLKKNFIVKFKKLVSFLKKFNDTTPNVRKRPWNYLGPLIEPYRILCKEKLTYYRTYKKIMRSNNLKCKFNKKLLKGESIDSLLKLIESGDKVILSHERKKLTPFLAKYILTELIDIELKRKKQNRLKFWYSIINKSDYTEFTCGKFCNYKGYFRRDPDRMIVHMGYQLLNSIRGSNILEKYAQMLSNNKTEEVLSLQKKKTTQSLGLECSLVIQRAIERTNVGDIRGRLKTTTMSKKLTCGKNALYSKSILTCEKELEFADLVKPKGHVYLFLGYHKLGEKYYITTIEAVGGDVRGVGIFFREFPYEKDNKLKCNLNLVWDKKDKKLKEPYPDEIYRVYRLR